MSTPPPVPRARPVSGPRKRGRSPVHGDRGAASLEYAGFLFVIVLLIASLILAATPIGGSIKAAICRALEVSCGTSPAEDRARDLGITCVVNKRDNEIGYNLAVQDIRGERKASDSVTQYGDGSGQVVISQGSGLGVEAPGASVKGVVGVKAKATVNGEAGFVYRFPEQFGGIDRAREFREDRRDASRTAASVALPPGSHAVEEGLTRAWGATRGFVQDQVLARVGLGPSPEERARRDRERQIVEADAVQVAISIQGQAGANIGDGVKSKTRNADGSTSSSTFDAPLAADVNAKLELKGSATVPLHRGNPDSVSSSFTGEVSGEIEGGVLAGGRGPVPPWLSTRRNLGGKGAYTVTFDENGEPTRLTVVGEYQKGGTDGIEPKVRERGGLKVRGKESDVVERTMILDLDPGTAAGRANRAAFDQAFITTGVDGARIAVPRALAEPLPNGMVNPVKIVSDWSSVQNRIERDGFIVDATYAEGNDTQEGDFKIAGWGVGGKHGTKERVLTGAQLRDNRNGGGEVQLASCAGAGG